MRYCTACASRFSQDVRFCPTDGQPTQPLPDENSSEFDPLLGMVVDGRYRIDRVIGEGGMGVVYAAMHVTLGKRVALKVLRGEMARDNEVVQRFVQEAQSSSSIGHANIIDITDFGRLEDGTSYFVMEYLEGESLTQLIERGGSMSADDAMNIIAQVASALGAAHARGIVHRDLKPDNIFLVERGGNRHFVKVLDFGIAKVGGANSKLTKTGMVFGTPHYMSPEQSAGQSIDARTDIYALGVIMYQMFTGEVPFDGDTFMGILSQHMFEPPIPPRDRVVAGQLAAEPIILRCLAKRPDERYPSMEALIADLHALGSGAEIAIGRSASQRPPPNLGAAVGRPYPSSSAPKPSTPPSEKHVGRWVALAAITTLLVCGALGGAAMALLQEPDGSAASGAYAEAAASPPSAPVPSMGEPMGDSPAAPAPPSGHDGQPGSAVSPAQGLAATAEGESASPSGSSAETVVEAPRAMVSIVTAPPGAMVQLDGALIGNTPLRFPRPDDSSEASLELTLAEYQSLRVLVSRHSPERIEVQMMRTSSRSRRGRSRQSERSTATPSTRPSTTPTETPSPPPPMQTTRDRRASEVVDPWN